jgi:hypothetical protein
MVSPISDIGISIAKTDILRILDSAREAQAKLNARIEANGQEPLEQMFYTAAEVDALREEHAAELEALKPTKPKSAWLAEKERRAAERERQEAEAQAARSPYADFAAALHRAPPEQLAALARGEHVHPEFMAWARQYDAEKRALASAESALDMIEAALKDSRFDISPMLREVIAPLLLTCPREKPDRAQARHITTWLDLMATAWGSEPSQPLSPSTPTPTPATGRENDEAEIDDAPPDNDAPDNVIALRGAKESSS